MSPIGLPLFLGFVLGLRHAFEPDHLAAVAALMGRQSMRRPGSAGRIGAWWGAGHAASLLLAGSGVILLGWRIPVRLEGLLEGAVALVLVALGVRILWRRLRGDVAHLHFHEHNGEVHTHLHFHREADAGHHHHPVTSLFRPGRRPFLVGMLHGLAGSAGATLLALAAARTPGQAMGALALFGGGALAGMAALSWLLGLPLAAAARTSATLHSRLRVTSGVTSLALGLALAFRVFFFLR